MFYRGFIFKYSISERLPDEPLIGKAGVITNEEDLPDWEPGKYGGIMRFGHSNTNWNPEVFIMLNEHVLIGLGISPSNAIGNIFLDYKISNKNTTSYLHCGKVYVGLTGYRLPPKM